MKNLLILMSLVLLTIGCHTSPPIETDLYIYLDFTEGQDYSHQITEDLDNYAELLQVGEHGSSNFGKVKIFPLYDLSAARSKTVKLKEGKAEFEANKFLRQKEVDKFKTKLSTALMDINEQYTGTALNSSHLIKPICKGMQKLNKSDADKKIVLIYSDMLENSTIQLINKMMEKLQKLLNFGEIILLLKELMMRLLALIRRLICRGYTVYGKPLYFQTIVDGQIHFTTSEN